MSDPQAKVIISIVAIFGVLLTIVGLYYVFVEKEGSAQLEIVLGEGNSVRIDLQESNKAPINEVLKTLFSNDESARMTRALLKEFHSLHELDSRLVDAIRNENPDTEFSQKIRKLLDGLEGPFSRNKHQYYNVSSTDVLDGLKNNGKEHRVTKKLRLMARDNEPPIFINESIPVKVSFPAQANISEGFAAVCNGKNYIGRNIVLRNSGNGAMIQVFARNTFTCNHNENRIQLMHKDADNLFGDRVRNTFENAEMTIAQPGMKFDIVQVTH